MADEIIVRIRAEGTERFIKDVKKTGVTVDKTADKVEESTQKMGASFKRLGGIIGGALAVATLVQFTKTLAKLALEIDATGKKVEKVFGESADVIDKFAKRNAISLGLTINEFKRAAAAAGDLLVPLGFQRREAARLSNDLVKLSGALAAWSGGQFNATQTSEILTKALLGEREQLKTLGINILESDVSTRLLEKGQKKLTGTALAQAKAMASLELIYEKSADAQSAFNDDTVTLVESSQKLSATMKTVTEELATRLIPFLSNAAEGTLNLIKRFTDFQRALNRITLGQNTEDFEDLVFVFSGLSEESLEAERAILKSSFSLDQGKKAAREYADAIAAINAVQVANKLNLVEVTEKINLFSGSGRLAGIQLAAFAQRFRDLTAETDLGGEEIIKVVGSLDSLKEALKAQQKIINETKPFSEEFNKAAIAANALKIEIKGIEKALKDMFKVVNQQQEIVDVVSIIEGVMFGEGGISDALQIPDNFAEIATDAAEESARIRRKFQQIERQETLEGRIALAEEITSQALVFGQQTFNIASGFIQAELTALDNRFKQGLIKEQEFNEQRAEILTKQAKADKAAAIIESIINTAVAATKALPNPVLFALALALGAAQTAVIAAQPIPQFAEGTKDAPPGFAWVGEEGRELVKFKGGEKVFTAEDSEDLMKLYASYGIPVQFKTTHDDLYKPMKTLKDITSNSAFAAIDWNPLLNASDMQRRSLGKKLDLLHVDLVKMNGGLNRRMTRS